MYYAWAQVFPTRVGGGGMLLETGQKILGLLIYVVLVKDTCRILCGALVLPPSDHLENHILRLAISIFKVIRLWYTGRS